MGSQQASYGFVPDSIIPHAIAVPALPSGDGALVCAARAGDRWACHAIWEKYTPVVQRLVRRFFGPGPDLPDVCQESFLRIFRRLDEVREPEALAGFILSVTLGVARNEFRRRKIRAIMGLRPIEDMPGQTDEWRTQDAREEIAALYRLLDRLSAGERSLFVSRYVEKLEITEVATIHDISISTAKRRLRRLTETVDRNMEAEPALKEYVGRLRQRETL